MRCKLTNSNRWSRAARARSLGVNQSNPSDVFAAFEREAGEPRKRKQRRDLRRPRSAQFPQSSSARSFFARTLRSIRFGASRRKIRCDQDKSSSSKGGFGGRECARDGAQKLRCSRSRAINQAPFKGFGGTLHMLRPVGGRARHDNANTRQNEFRICDAHDAVQAAQSSATQMSNFELYGSEFRFIDGNNSSLGNPRKRKESAETAEGTEIQ